MQNVSLEYRQTLTEINFILEHTEKKYLNKIPKKFRSFVYDNQDPYYKVTFDLSKDFREWILKPKTKALLALIYKDYFCDPEQKYEYQKKLLKNEEKRQKELKEKYNPDNIFKNRSKIEANTAQTTQEIVKYKPQNFIQKLFAKFKILFNKN